MKRRKFTIVIGPNTPPIPDHSADYAAWIDGEEEHSTWTGETPADAFELLSEQIIEELVDEEDSPASEVEP